MEGHCDSQIAPRGHFMFRAFKHKNFGLFFTGQSVSLIGTWSQGLAISWLVWRITHSASWLGFINFVVQFPILILGLVGGFAADRFDRHRGLAILQIMCMLQATALALLTLTGRITLWQIVILSIFLGIVYSFEFPFRLAFVQDMVGREDLLNAISLNAAMIHSTRMMGPVVAGFVVALFGEGICFLFNAATFLALIIALLCMNRQKLYYTRYQRMPMWHSIAEGLRHIWSVKNARYSIILVAVVSIFGMPFIALLPIFADEIFKGGALHLGWMMGASGFGSLVGALWLARRNSHEGLLNLAARSSFIFSLGIVAFAFSNRLPLTLAALAIASFFLTITFASINTLLQHTAPDRLRGRIVSLFSTAFMGFAPIGSLLGGFLAREIGASHTVALCGATCAASAVLVWIKAGASTHKS